MLVQIVWLHSWCSGLLTADHSGPQFNLLQRSSTHYKPIGHAYKHQYICLYVSQDGWPLVRGRGACEGVGGKREGEGSLPPSQIIGLSAKKNQDIAWGMGGILHLSSTVASLTRLARAFKVLMSTPMRRFHSARAGSVVGGCSCTRFGNRRDRRALNACQPEKKLNPFHSRLTNNFFYALKTEMELTSHGLLSCRRRS